MKKEGTKRHDFLRMLAILIIIMIFKTFFINSLMVTIVNAVADPGINGSVVNTFVGYMRRRSRNYRLPPYRGRR